VWSHLLCLFDLLFDNGLISPACIAEDGQKSISLIITFELLNNKAGHTDILFICAVNCELVDFIDCKCPNQLH